MSNMDIYERVKVEIAEIRERINMISQQQEIFNTHALELARKYRHAQDKVMMCDIYVQSLQAHVDRLAAYSEDAKQYDSNEQNQDDDDAVCCHEWVFSEYETRDHNSITLFVCNKCNKLKKKISYINKK